MPIDFATSLRGRFSFSLNARNCSPMVDVFLVEVGIKDIFCPKIKATALLKIFYPFFL
jgi:hypothetical protein